MDKIRAVLQGLGDHSIVAFLVLSMWGGLVAYLQRVLGQGVPFSLFRLVIELTTSGFVGMMMYFLCLYWDINGALMAVVVGISGHMGTRALVMLEQYYKRFVGGGGR